MHKKLRVRLKLSHKRTNLIASLYLWKTNLVTNIQMAKSLWQ